MPFILVLGLGPGPSAQGQLLYDLSTLEHTLDAQRRWADSLRSVRRDSARRLLTIAREVFPLRTEVGSRRTLLLKEARQLADGITDLDEKVATAARMEEDTRARLIQALEDRAAALFREARNAEPPRSRVLEDQAAEVRAEIAHLTRKVGGTPSDLLEVAGPTLLALAEAVADEHAHVRELLALEEELRLFLGDLRLLDETGMPPSARSGGGGGQDPGCPPTACPAGPPSPADLPMVHLPSEGPGGEGTLGSVEELTPASLSELFVQLQALAGAERPEEKALSTDNPWVTREVTLGGGALIFRGNGQVQPAPGTKARASLAVAWPLGDAGQITLEPSLAGRTLREDGTSFTELAGEMRINLQGGPGDGRSRWRVSSWQKGRHLSRRLTPPGYLEPGRREGGVLARLALPLSSVWEATVEGGVGGIRYEPDDWRVLDRQGVTGALGVRWAGSSRSANLSFSASHYGFPHPLPESGPGRRDTRLSLQVGGALEGRWIARVSAGGSWNQSRLPAYDFRTGRAALALSAPLGRGSLQAYASVAHQVYANPGSEEARVAPSDHDSGSTLSLQYSRPLDASRALMLRSTWSRSETGFRNEFNERLGISLYLAFRGS